MCIKLLIKKKMITTTPKTIKEIAPQIKTE